MKISTEPVLNFPATLRYLSLAEFADRIGIPRTILYENVRRGRTVPCAVAERRMLINPKNALAQLENLADAITARSYSNAYVRAGMLVDEARWREKDHTIEVLPCDDESDATKG